jgi:hypothetical protein
MSQSSDPRNDLDLLTKMQQSEANLHWQRNGFFLLVSSILFVAASQFNSQLLLVSFGIAGFLLNLLWLLIQQRSSSYIGYWKGEARKLTAAGAPDIYSPKVKGVQMRYVAYFLPVPFLFLWAALIVSAIVG